MEKPHKRMRRGRYVKVHPSQFLDVADRLLRDPGYKVVASYAMAEKLVAMGEVYVSGQRRVVRSTRIGPNECEVRTDPA